MSHKIFKSGRNMKVTENVSLNEIKDKILKFKNIIFTTKTAVLWLTFASAIKHL